ncbi:hypothetical protein [Paenibacillus sp. Marseille-Q4541]|uniref:hypothetical protein n=1 Tax=Paenibacillus sp. Marseille-Q4541 TaxID=2831522 RepID=UPI001BACA54C|nr:hypothetical protein [Paenibacillus sp. Marseille-Q4541]
MMGKDRYDNIEIPNQLEEVIKQSQKRAAAHKSSLRMKRYTSMIAACIAFLIAVNIPSVAVALSKLPIVGSIVQVFQFGEGGERTDGIRVETEAVENKLNIHFGQEGESVATVPAYTVDHRDAPNRLIFTFNGIRNFNYDKMEKDLLALPLVKDVYQNIILDDSAMRFVVELKEGAKHSVTEFKDPGYIELKLTSDGQAVTPREVFYIRSEEMEQGESLAILEEIYLEDDLSFIKTANGKFIGVIGGYNTIEEAESKFKEISERESYTGELHVDSWMSNERPD